MLLGKRETSLKLSDVKEEAAECEATLQRTWEQRIGLRPLRIQQNTGACRSHRIPTNFVQLDDLVCGQGQAQDMLMLRNMFWLLA